jgi:uncharacterized protein DUF4232
MTIASMGKRHTALLGLVMCAAGCGWSQYPTAIPSSPPTASLPVCQAPELSPSVKELSPPTGLNPIAIRLTNVGDPCTLRGYPSLIFVSTHMKRMNFHITHTADQVVRGDPPRRLTLQHGGSVWLAMDKYRCDSGDLSHVRFTAIHPQGTEGSVPVNAPRGWGYCGPGDPGSTVVVSPFEPTLAATLRHQ